MTNPSSITQSSPRVFAEVSVALFNEDRLSRRNRTEPSHRAKLAPPVWFLLH